MLWSKVPWSAALAGKKAFRFRLSATIAINTRPISPFDALSSMYLPDIGALDRIHLKVASPVFVPFEKSSLNLLSGALQIEKEYHAAVLSISGLSHTS